MPAFVNRAAELAAIQRALDSDRAELIIVYGRKRWTLWLRPPESMASRFPPHGPMARCIGQVNRHGSLAR